MKRNEIADKYKWRLEDIVSTDEEWEKLYNEIASYESQLKSYEGKLGDKKMLKECLECNEKVDTLIGRMYCYARMRRDQDGSVQKYIAFTDKAMGLMIRLSTATSYMNSEISSLSEEYLSDVISDKDFEPFDFMLKEIVRAKKYILSDKEEKLLSMASQATGNYSEIFTTINNVELPMPTIKTPDGDVKLTHGNYGLFLQSSDKSLRESAFQGMYGAYKKLINTICNTYAGSVKKDNFYARARGYEDCLQQSLFGDNVPKDVYNQLINAVDENTSVMHKYMELRKKALGYKEMHMYDLSVAIFENADLKLSYEDAYELVIKGLKPLGEEYASLLREARDHGWIDVMENEGKRSGAYSWGCYGVHPYVLLNYSQTTHDVFTIAHELGHAMHTYYSNKTWGLNKSQYQIFVAEVASTVNEVFLLKHLISTVEDKLLKKYLLSYYIDMFRTTLFRQTMFAEFEKIAHDMELNGKPLTVDSLSEEYYALNKKYYGDAVTHDDDIRYEWARIPHFYNSFYVYKYATGITSAINIVNSILADPKNVERYKKFLCAGGSDSPYNILKNAGVDLATKHPYEVAMKEFNDTLKLLEKEI
ncbi:MAG: oligoendopeptidase F [Clostridiales bacterium]|nr:oligoendopeptidase F [Clostridiales bacterium]